MGWVTADRHNLLIESDIFSNRDLTQLADITVQTEMSAGRAKPGSRLGTDRLFRISDRVRVTILKSEPDPGSPKLHYGSS